MNDESPVEAWMGAPDTKKDVKLVRDSFPDVSQFQAACFVLGIHVLAILESTYASDPGPSEPMPMDMGEDDEPEEPWRGKR